MTKHIRINDFSGGLNLEGPKTAGMESPDIRGALLDRANTARKRRGYTRGISSGWTLDAYRGRGLGWFQHADGTVYPLYMKESGPRTSQLYRYVSGGAATAVKQFPHLKYNASFLPARNGAGFAIIGAYAENATGTCAITKQATSISVTSSKWYTDGYGAYDMVWPVGADRWYRITNTPSSDSTAITIADEYEAVANLSAGSSYVLNHAIQAYDGTTCMDLCLIEPASAPTAAAGPATGDLTLARHYKFKYSYVNTKTGAESPMSAVIAAEFTITATLGVTITITNSTQGGVDGTNIYYDHDGSGTYTDYWKLLLPAGQKCTIQDNTTTTFDHVAVANETETINEDTTEPANFVAAFFAYMNGFVFAAGDPAHPNWLRFSECDKPHSWPAENYVVVGTEPITGLFVISGRLVVFSRHQRHIASMSYYYFETDPDTGETRIDTDLRQEPTCPDSNDGCVAPASIFGAGGWVAYMSDNGPQIMAGAQCPSILAIGLGDIIRRLNTDYLDQAVGALDPFFNEAVFSFPLDSSTINNTTVRISMKPKGARPYSGPVIDPRGWSALARVQTSSTAMALHSASTNCAMVSAWSKTATNDIATVSGVCTSAGASATLVSSAAFTSYTTGFKLAGQLVALVKSNLVQFREVIGVADANTISVTPAWTTAPATGDSFCVGVNPLFLVLPPLRGEPAEENRYKALRRVVLETSDDIVTAKGILWLMTKAYTVGELVSPDFADITGFTMHQRAATTNRIEWNPNSGVHGRDIRIGIGEFSGSEFAFSNVDIFYDSQGER